MRAFICVRSAALRMLERDAVFTGLGIRLGSAAWRIDKLQQFAWNLLISYSFVALGVSLLRLFLTQVSDRFTGSSVTLKDGAGDNLSLQTHALALIYSRPQVLLHSCRAPVSCPLLVLFVDPEPLTLHHDLIAEASIFFAVFRSCHGNKVCCFNTGDVKIWLTHAWCFVVCLPTYSQSGT